MLNNTLTALKDGHIRKEIYVNSKLSFETVFCLSCV